ncbi:MAG: acyl-CoA dehydrogenase [Rhizobiaceae bacterium]|nr:acyl-CoA dehydrogenase [Rhizobiaceae bacterium]MCV0404608.1 acyl-CoA dehydrogenase [Rhizobiaceae bacterium]
MIEANRAELSFQLFEMADVDGLSLHDRFSAWDRDSVEAALDTAQHIAFERFLPHAAELDANEPEFVDGRVVMNPKVAEALQAYREAGFFGAGFDEEWGGAQMPETVRQAASFLFLMANVGTASYPFLTIGAANLIASFGTDGQKRRYLRPMIEGRFFGTMALSEPQAGSSLSDITTRAEPRGDGTYRLIGRKMWISGGDQEISETIVHMVLARITGAPAGVKGISLFIAPKHRVCDDGTVGERNGVTLAGLNHKMGYRGTTNALLNFGEEGECVAELVGEPHHGLVYMFQMMNEARIGVGLGATAIAAAGYSVSLAYARERPQGRQPDGKDPVAPQIPIIGHADIRRLLLAQKAAIEGALALCLYCARLVDDLAVKPHDESRRDDELLLDLLTPIAKSWPSEFCLEANKHAIQVLGGYGYTRDYPVERLYRDNRLNPIHEGTHGIQGLDLLGRKVVQAGGAGLRMLAARIRADIDAAGDEPELSEFAGSLEIHLQGLLSTTACLAEALTDRPRLALANATLYLDMAGHVVIAWMWLRQARATLVMKAEGRGGEGFSDGKLAACRYFFRYELPKTGPQRDLLDALDDTTLAIRPDWF